MDTANLEITTRDEINAELLRLLANRQALYDVSSELIMLDYRPEFAKLHRRGSRALGFELKSASLLDSLGHLRCRVAGAVPTVRPQAPRPVRR